MPSHELEAIADAWQLARYLQLDGAVLGRNPQTARFRNSHRDGQTRMGAHRLEAGVDDDAGWRRPAGHCRKNCQGAGEIQVLLRAIIVGAEDRSAGLDFRDTRLTGAIGKRAASPTAYDGDPMALGPAGRRAPGQ